MEDVLAVQRLAERDRELARLVQVVDDVRSGAGRVVAILGEAGIGKTTLLDEVAVHAARAGLRVLRARAVSVERGFAYGVARRLLEVAAQSGSRELLAGPAAHSAHALGVGGSVDSADEFAVQRGLFWFVANLAETAPLLLCVDDAQCADPQSWRWLMHLGREIGELPVGIVLTWRTADPTGPVDALRELETEPHVHTLRPDPLSESATAALVADALLGEPATEFAHACHVVSGGNPFYLRELLVALAADGVEPTAAQAPRVSETGSVRVVAAVLRRLGQLDEPTRELARAVAVLDADASLRVVAELAGQSPADAGRAADALVAARLLAPAWPLRYVHPVVRAAVYGDLGLGERSALHRRAAALLCADPETADRGAAHLLRVEPAGDVWVVEQLSGAASRGLAGGAPDAATVLLERALAEPPPLAQRATVLGALGVAQLRAGDSAAETTLQRAAEMADDPRALLFARAYALFLQTRFREASDALEPLVQTDPEAFARFAGMRIIVDDLALTVREHLDRTLADGLAGTRAGRALGVTAAIDRLLTMRTSAAAVAELVQPFLHSGDSLEAVESGDARWAIAALWATMAYDEGERQGQALVERARAAGVSWAGAAAEIWLAAIAFERGDILATVEHCEASLTSADGSRLPLARPHRVGLLAMAHLLADRVDEARAVFEREQAEEELPLLATAVFALRARSLLRLAEGRLEAAHADALEIERRAALRGGLFGGIRPWLVPVFVAAGDHDRAAAIALADHAAATRFGTPHWLGAAERGLGLVEGDLARLERSVALLESTPCRIELACSLVELGAALRRRRQREAAREPLRRGLDLAHRCGATAIARRAHEELEATGARPRSVVLTGIEALTPAELRAARLAAQGYTNREIAQQLWVSPKTVESQLRSVYQKLDIASRRELPAALP